MMACVSGGWVLRPFSGVADHGRVEALWLAAAGTPAMTPWTWSRLPTSLLWWPSRPPRSRTGSAGSWPGTGDILLARDSAGTFAATLLLDGPGADSVYGPMLGPAAATISFT
jgi:hypothetical protein